MSVLCSIPKRDVVIVHKSRGIALSRPPRLRWPQHTLLDVVILELIGEQDTIVRRRGLLQGELFRAPHGPLIDEPADGDTHNGAEEDAQVVDDAGARRHVVAVGELTEPVANEYVHEQLRRREGGREREGPRGDARDRGEEAVAQAEGKRAEADGDQHGQPVMPQDLAEGDEAAVLADEPVHVGAEDGAARDEGGRGPDDGGAGDDGPAGGEAEDEAGDGDGRAVADHGREGGQGGQQEQEDPAPRDLPPGLGHGMEGGEDAVGEDEEHDGEGEDGEPAHGGHDTLQRRHTVAELEELVRDGDAALHDALPERLALPCAGAAARVGHREAPHARLAQAVEEIIAAVGVGASPWRQSVGAGWERMVR